MIVGLFWIIGYLVVFGLITLFLWWIKYAVAVLYAMIPTMAIIELILAIPIIIGSLLFPGSWFDIQTTIFMHWFNDILWNIIKFALALPFNLFIWPVEIINWIIN